MLVFLCKIPENTRDLDIVEFISPALKGSWYNPLDRSGNIEEVKIQTIKDHDLDTVEHHGLVRIEPDSAAERVIRQLNRKPLKGKRIEVREYVFRSWRNDPRNVIPDDELEFKDRRKTTRRRSNLEVVEDESALFSSNKNFHRRY